MSKKFKPSKGDKYYKKHDDIKGIGVIIIKNNILVVLFLLLLTNCSFKKDTALSETDTSLYKRGIQEIKLGEYKDAAKTFITIENDYPASPYYPDTLILKAYSFYSSEKYTDAILTIDDFLQQFPMHKDAAYMYYLRGMSNYNQIMDIGRDSIFATIAKRDFDIIMQLYPYSKYAEDVKWKLEYIKNIAAGKEMEIGRFYLRVSKPISAVNRFKYVVENYQTSIFTQEALYRLVEVYYILGVKKEAQRYGSVLGHNYPKSIWYEKAYNLLVEDGSKRKSSTIKQVKKHLFK
jgi:outer membrane protein assembly factor BamD